VAVYTCGPHLQRPLQIAEARRFVMADLLCRYLRWRGLAVKQVVDLMDLDNGLTPAAPDVDRFMQEIEFLGIRPADHYASSRDHVEDMLSLARKLADKGIAYDKLRSLYFDLSRAPGYGRLSGIDVAKVKVGATVDLTDYEKQNPRDFALLRRCRLSELKRGAFIKSAWGNVRPAWHLQTAAVAMKCLGEAFDIHTSSHDLVFPHHENENAIAEALFGKPLARCWIQSDQVLGETPPVRDLAARGFSGREIRYWFFSVHYRKPLAFSMSRLEDARRSLQRLDRCVRSLMHVSGRTPCPEADQLVYDLRQGLRTALDDDLNLPAAMSAAFKTVRRINTLIAGGLLDAQAAGRLLATLRDMDAVLNLFDFKDSPAADPTVQDLIEDRERARVQRDWALADRLRAEIISRGSRVQDPKTK
jgi:cysteinyl-tRNA synthetase